MELPAHRWRSEIEHLVEHLITWEYDMEKCWGTNLDHLEDFLVRYPLVGTVYRTAEYNYTGPEH